jgi:hypothetical protein
MLCISLITYDLIPFLQKNVSLVTARLVGELEGRKHLEDLGVDERIMLKYILKK